MEIINIYFLFKIVEDVSIYYVIYFLMQLLNMIWNLILLF